MGSEIFFVRGGMNQAEVSRTFNRSIDDIYISGFKNVRVIAEVWVIVDSNNWDSTDAFFFDFIIRVRLKKGHYI